MPNQQSGNQGQGQTQERKQQADKSKVTKFFQGKRTIKADAKLDTASDILTEICKVHGLTVARFRELAG